MSRLMLSWIGSANTATCPFPLNNLPYGVFDCDGGDAAEGHQCTAIGDKILDLRRAEESGLLDFGGLLQEGTWNGFMAAGAETWARLRGALQAMLAESAAAGLRESCAPCLTDLRGVRMHLPFTIAEYTDFYAGRHHAMNVGTMMRGAENALPPNWNHIPIGYNGRASSVVISGTPVIRPHGQLKPADAEMPHFAPSRAFDMELELGAIVGRASTAPLTVDEAFANIFGYVLLNDWSARDIQGWEYQPLGPFQAKATATTISPWIVTAAALEPHLVAAPERVAPLLDYIRDTGPMLYDIALEAGLTPAGGRETIITRTNYREMYYSSAQQLAHHSSSGCPMRVGDLLGTGTISGETRESRGSLLELSWRGAEPLELDCGAVRSFLEDGDTIRLGGAAMGDGYRIGFGDCIGRVLPARERG